jgi:translation elongation factor EF-1beta
VIFVKRTQENTLASVDLRDRDRMGDALVVFKIHSEDPENLDKIEEELKNIEVGKFQECKREPIGFGIELIKVGYIIPDKTDGVMPKLEQALEEIEGVSNVEAAGMTLL